MLVRRSQQYRAVKAGLCSIEESITAVATQRFTSHVCGFDECRVESNDDAGWLVSSAVNGCNGSGGSNTKMGFMFNRVIDSLGRGRGEQAS